MNGYIELFRIVVWTGWSRFSVWFGLWRLMHSDPFYPTNGILGRQTPIKASRSHVSTKCYKIQTHVCVHIQIHTHTRARTQTQSMFSALYCLPLKAKQTYLIRAQFSLCSRVRFRQIMSHSFPLRTWSYQEVAGTNTSLTVGTVLDPLLLIVHCPSVQAYQIRADFVITRAGDTQPHCTLSYWSHQFT